MVKFSPEPDACKSGADSYPIPGKGKLGAARTAGGNAKYPVGDGPKGKGGGHQLGPTGTTSGAGGTRISGFHGATKSFSGALANVRNRSNPMKR